MKILIVNGKPRCGKSLFCQTAYEKRGLVYSWSTIEEVKLLAQQLGWDGKKDEAGRKFLSDLKDILTNYNDLPYRFVENKLKEIEEFYKGTPYEDGLLFLIMTREPKEIERWENEHGARSLIIVRSGLKKEWGNHADNEVYNHDYHYMIYNNRDLEGWKKQIVDFIDKVRDEEWESYI